MAWINVPDDRATPELERLTAPWLERGQQVPPVMAVLKAHPRAFSAVAQLNYAVTFGASSLGRRREELIAVWVSALNGCFFCLATHARYLEQQWPGGSGDLVALLKGLKQLGENAREPARLETVSAELEVLNGLSADDLELLRFVLDLTLTPHASTAAGFVHLRKAGFTQAEIVDVVLVAGCFALMNRLANGTGVVLDSSKYAEAERMFGRAALDQHLAESAPEDDSASESLRER